jgi:hypothetical protein
MANEPPRDERHRNGPNERQMTSDPERVREWAETRDAVPVSTRTGEGHGHTFVRRGEIGDEHEEHTWEEFTEAFVSDDLVFVYHEEKAPTGEELGFFEIVERDRAFERTGLGRDEFEESLRRGDTVTTEIVETQVVETEIVERDTIESEVIDSETVDREVVDSELLRREIVETEFVDDETIQVIVDETRLDTIEEIERYTVESRVVDVDVEQHGELERDEIETTIELESVQRSLLQSDVVRSDVTPDEVIEREVIQSNRTEGDAVRSELIERRTIEEEVEVERRLRFGLEEAEQVTSEVGASELIEGEIIDPGEYAAAESTAGAEGVESDADATADAEAEADEAPVADADAMPLGESTVELSPDDRGKDVVNERGGTIGIVAEIEGQTAYVDPEPGLTDRLKARLNWGGHGGDDYPVDAAQIAEITDDEIVLRSE